MSEKGHFRPIGSNGFLPAARHSRNFASTRRGPVTVSACLESLSRHFRPLVVTNTPNAPSTGLSAGTISAGTYSPATGAATTACTWIASREPGAESPGLPAFAGRMQLAQNILTSFKEPIAVAEVAPNTNVIHLNAPPHPQARQSRCSSAALHTGDSQRVDGIVTASCAPRRPGRALVTESPPNFLRAPAYPHNLLETL